MNRIQLLSLSAGLAFPLLLSTSQAQTTVTNTFSVGTAIPDGSLSGLSDTRTVHFDGLTSITDLKITLNISGGYNGDYFGYVVHNGGYAVLLNRPGRTDANSEGYAGNGFNVTFSDASPNDVHVYQNITLTLGPLTGDWAPDGRNVPPGSVLDTDARTAFLSSFNGVDPNGEWTLFLADMSSGGQGTLVSWGLVTTAVPEPSTLALGLFGGVGMLVMLRRVRTKK